MDTKLYRDTKKFVKHGAIPKQLPSTRSNFIAQAKKYKVNRKGVLMRDKKPVVQMSQRDKIFEAMHQHSGRTPCWERIRER